MTYLDNHIYLILNSDSFLELEKMHESINDEYVRSTAKSIHETLLAFGDNLHDTHTNISKKLQRYFVCVQEKPFDLYATPRDAWDKMLEDNNYRQNLFDISTKKVNQIVHKMPLLEVDKYYGSLKSTSSLQKKINGTRYPDSETEVSLQIWDLIRYRIVTKNLSGLRNLSNLIWREEFDNVIRCRNYYYHPKIGDHSEPYRAIHFQIGLENLGSFELQVMSSNREVTSIFDQEFTFKNDTPFIDEGHLIWLNNFQLSSNIYDWLMMGKS